MNSPVDISSDVEAIKEKLMRSATDTTKFCAQPVFRNPDGPEAASLIGRLHLHNKAMREGLSGQSEFLRNLADGDAMVMAATLEQQADAIDALLKDQGE